MIVTISGDPGSGKSTVAKLVARELGFRHYSIGDLRGRMALEKGLTIDELNVLGEKEAWTDKEADDYLAKVGMEEDNLVIDARLGFHFVPHSFKVYLQVDPVIAAKRIILHPRPDEPAYGSVEELVEYLKQRVASDVKRYEKYYGIDYREKKHYDLVLATGELTAEEVAEKITSAIDDLGMK